MKISTQGNLGRAIMSLGVLLATHTSAWAAQCRFNIQYLVGGIDQYLSAPGSCLSAFTAPTCACDFVTDPNEGVQARIKCSQSDQSKQTIVPLQDGWYSIASQGTPSEACVLDQ